MYQIQYNRVPLEDKYYTLTHLGQYEFLKQSSFLRLDLKNFFVATSLNAGPFALLLNNKMISSGASDYRNKIILYSSFGEKLKEILLKDLLGPDFNEKQFWVHIGMTREEDIFMMGVDGLMFIIDL